LAFGGPRELSMLKSVNLFMKKKKEKKKIEFGGRERERDTPLFLKKKIIMCATFKGRLLNTVLGCLSRCGYVVLLLFFM
jgi:hypothetical protein